MTTTIRPASAGRAPAPGAAVTGGDMLGDILTEAYRPGAAPPVAVHVRRELGDVLVHRLPPGVSRPPFPFVIDDELPAAPGYEIHRSAPEDLVVGAVVHGGRGGQTG
jgi:hypothetical protein